MATYNPALNCAEITNMFREMTGSMSKEVYRRTQRRSPIVDLMMQTRGEFPLGIGHTLTTLTTARNFPLDPVSFRATIGPSLLTGESYDPTPLPGQPTDDTVSGPRNSCLPPTILTEHGSIEYTTQPTHLAVNTPKFCADDIKFDWQFAKQTENVTKQLTDITDHVLTEWFLHDYHRIAQHHIVQNIAGPNDIGNAAWSTASAPTGYLSMGALSAIYNAMYREGGDQPLARDMDDESPVFGLILGKEASDLLFTNNTQLAENIRWAWMGARDESPLLPSGMPRKRRNFGGFMHYITPYPRRYDASGVRVPTWVSSAADKGRKQTVNQAYLSAASEEIIIFHRSNYRSLGVPGLTSPSSGWDYKSQNSMGEFSVRNIPNEDCNPDENVLFFRAIFRDAAEALNPDLGYTMLVRNCGYNQGSADCAAGTGPEFAPGGASSTSA